MPDSELSEWERRKRLMENALAHGFPPPMDTLFPQLQAQMAQRDFAGAKQTVARMPDTAWRDFGYSAIATAQGIANDVTGARQTAQAIRFPISRISVLSQIAYGQGFHKNPKTARSTADEARQMIGQLSSPVLKEKAFDSIASAYLQIPDVTEARKLVAQMKKSLRKASLLTDIAGIVLQAGNKNAARSTAREAWGAYAYRNREVYGDDILRRLFAVLIATGDGTTAYATIPAMREKYNRADSLAQLAEAVARGGAKPEAVRLVREARQQWAGTTKYVNGYEQDRTREYIVYALVAIGDIAGAKKTTDEIFDPSRRQRAEKAIENRGRD